MVRRLLSLATVAVAVLASGAGASAQTADASCTWPATPGGQVIGPDLVQLGETIGFGVEYDQPGEGNYAIDQVYEVDGPDGHITLAQGQKLTPQAPGTYTVNGHWTETCGDGVTPDRTVTGRPLTVTVEGPQPPFGSVELRQGGHRLPGGRREPATALLHVGCPQNRIDEPLRVTATLAGRTVTIVRTHGCFGYKLSRGAGRQTKRWEIGVSDFGGQIFVRAPARLTGHFELRSGERVVAAADVRFRPNARGRERVSVLRAGCRLNGGCPGP